MRHALFATLVVTLAACARPSPSDLILARVNGEAITAAQLDEGFTANHQGHGVLLAGRGAVRDFLEQVIDRRLLVQEARRIGGEEQPDIQKWRAALRAKRAGEGLFRAEVTNKVVVREEQVAAVYSQLGERFSARHILVSSREGAEQAFARIKAGEEFGEVARQLSRAATANRGGDLGIVQWGRLDPTLEKALWALGPGDTSEPFESEEGWNLLHVTDRTSEELPKLGEARSRIRATLVQRLTRAGAGALFRRLMTQSGAVIDEAPLVAALVAAPGAGSAPTAVVVDAAGERITVDRALKLVNVEAARKLPPDRMRRQARGVLEAEVFRILLEKEGLARGYGDTPAVLRELDEGTDEAIFEHLLGSVVLARVQVGDAEIEAYYRSHAKEYTEPEAIQISALLVEGEDEAQEVLRELRGGAELGALARRRSKDPSTAASGGEIPGWLTRGKLDPAVEAVAFSLRREGTLGVAKVSAGYFVVRLERRRPERVKPLDEVREAARTAALRQRSREAVKGWVTKLRQASTIDVDDAAIDRAIASYEASAAERARKAEEMERAHGGRAAPKR
ncbi:MAG: peptidylprolyl isomerase [Candidatus Rokubacteria bacterium]|nr:peptidylprolyl isomerase [Candidatus Rokubacteria bacterium]